MVLVADRVGPGVSEEGRLVSEVSSKTGFRMKVSVCGFGPLTVTE